MPKIEITKELAQCLRALRLQHNLSTTKLSAAIGKSPAYISKLEKGEIHSIDINLFNEALLTVVGGNSESLNAAYDELANYFNLIFNSKELDQQIWFINFDRITRVIPIPESLVDEINSILLEHNITYEELLIAINSNLDLPEEDINRKVPYNQWFISQGKKDGTKSIKIKIESDILYGILEKRIQKIAYTFMESITYYTLRLSAGSTLTKAKNILLKEETTTLLNKHKFYSILEREELIKKSASEEDLSSVLSTHDLKNRKLIDEILEEMHYISDLDVTEINKFLESLRDNMNWDLGFVMALNSIPLNLLTNTEFEDRQKMLNEINEIFLKYKNSIKKQTTNKYTT